MATYTYEDADGNEITLGFDYKITPGRRGNYYCPAEPPECELLEIRAEQGKAIDRDNIPEDVCRAMEQKAFEIYSEPQEREYDHEEELERRERRFRPEDFDNA